MTPNRIRSLQWRVRDYSEIRVPAIVGDRVSVGLWMHSEVIRTSDVAIGEWEPHITATAGLGSRPPGYNSPLISDSGGSARGLRRIVSHSC